MLADRTIVCVQLGRRSMALQMTASFTNWGRAPTIEQTRIGWA
jgi:hypothetical protein